MNRGRAILLVAVFFIVSSASAVEKWTIDKTHSHVGFKVRHFVSKVPGEFKEFDGTIVTDFENPEHSSVEFRISTASIDTGSSRRDDHLRSEDFFHAEAFPEIAFRSTSITRAGDDLYHVTGDLTMRDVTRKVTLPVRWLGSIKTPRGAKGGFETTLKINRTDFNVNWNNPLDGGGFVLGEEVEIAIDLEVNLVVEKAPE